MKRVSSRQKLNNFTTILQRLTNCIYDNATYYVDIDVLLSNHILCYVATESDLSNVRRVPQFNIVTHSLSNPNNGNDTGNIWVSGSGDS
mgnify:FL=1